MKKSETCLNKAAYKRVLSKTHNLSFLILLAVFALFYFVCTFFDVYDLPGYGYNLFTELKESAVEIHHGVEGFYYSYNFTYSQTSFVEVAFGVIFAAANFDFMLNKSKLYTHLGFAAKRSDVYKSKVISPILCGTLIIIAIKIISALVNGAYMGFHVNLVKGIIANILTSLMIFIMGYTLTILTIMFTGRRIEACAFLFSLLMLPTAIESMVTNIFTGHLKGYAYDSYMYEPTHNEITLFFSYLNPTKYISDYSTSGEYIPINGFVSFKDEYIIALLWLAVFIGTLILCERYFVKKFKPEDIGKKAKSKVVTVISSASIPLLAVQTINLFSYTPGISDISAISTAMIITSAITVLILAIIVSMIITRSGKAFVWGAIGGGAMGLACILTYVIATTGCFGFATRIPDKNNIEAIEVSLPFDDMINNTTEKFFLADSFDYYGSMNLSDSISITNKEDFDIIRNIHSSVLEKSDDKTAITFDVTYTLKNGRAINRKFPYISENAAKEYLNLWKTQPIQDGLKVLLNQDENNDFKAYPDSQTYTYSSSITNPYLYDESEDIWGASSNVVFAIKPENVILVTKDMNLTQFATCSDSHDKKRTFELMEAIYKDAQLLSAEEWFAPEKEIGAIAFCSYGNGADNKSYYEIFKLANTVFYINSNMKNTLAVLDKYDYTKYFECKKDVVAAHLVDVNDVAKWKHSSEDHLLSYYITQEGLHGTYFTQDYYAISDYIVNGCNYRNISVLTVDGQVSEISYPDEFFVTSEDGYNMTTQEVITDLNYAKELVNDAYMAYNVGNHGKFLVVKFSDGTEAMLVVPEKQ